MDILRSALGTAAAEHTYTGSSGWMLGASVFCRSREPTSAECVRSHACSQTKYKTDKLKKTRWPAVLRLTLVCDAFLGHISVKSPSFFQGEGRTGLFCFLFRPAGLRDGERAGSAIRASSQTNFVFARRAHQVLCVVAV